MSAEYSVGQILAAAEAAENGDVRHPGMIADMLRELARIRADDAVDGRIDFKGMWNDMSDRTTTHPPAQAVEEMRPTLSEFARLPDAERVAIGQKVAERVDELQASAAEPVAQGEAVTPEPFRPALVALLRIRDSSNNENDANVSRAMFDALTTIGWLEKTGRNLWSLTSVGESALATHPHSPDAADSAREAGE